MSIYAIRTCIHPNKKHTDVLRLLDEENIDYAITDESGESDYDAMVSFPLPRDAVESTLDCLRDVDVSDDAWTVVLDAQTVVSHRLDRSSMRDTDRIERLSVIVREELQTAAEDLAPERSEGWSYVAMTVISAVIAVVGLLQNSAAVVVGSMVIAPLIGPAMAAAVGTVTDNSALTTRGVRLQILGLGLAIVSAAAFAAVARYVGLVPPGTAITQIPEIRSRLAPDFLSLAAALGAGVAGAISLTTGAGAALVGVMIAVALIPPAATVGIGLAWRQPLVSLGSGVLALVNVLSISLAALIVLWIIGYRPRDPLTWEAVRATMKQRIRILALALVILSVFLGGVTYLSYQSTQFEQQVEDEVHDLLNEQPYRNLALLDFTVGSSQTTIAFDEAGLTAGEPIQVVVKVDKPPEANYPTFATTLDRRLTQRTGHDVTVEVRFVDADQTTPSRSSRTSPVFDNLSALKREDSSVGGSATDPRRQLRDSCALL